MEEHESKETRPGFFNRSGISPIDLEKTHKRAEDQFGINAKARAAGKATLMIKNPTTGEITPHKSDDEGMAEVGDIAVSGEVEVDPAMKPELTLSMGSKKVPFSHS